MENKATINSPEYARLSFTVLAIEASALKMGISPSEMRKRLDKVGLLRTWTAFDERYLHSQRLDRGTEEQAVKTFTQP